MGRGVFVSDLGKPHPGPPCAPSEPLPQSSSGVGHARVEGSPRLRSCRLPLRLLLRLRTGPRCSGLGTELGKPRLTPFSGSSEPLPQRFWGVGLAGLIGPQRLRLRLLRRRHVSGNETVSLGVPCRDANRPAMSCVPEGVGQLLPSPFRHRVLTFPVVCADNVCVLGVRASDSVGACVLDCPVGEPARAEVLCFPRVQVSDDEFALRCGLCQHENRRITPLCRIRADVLCRIVRAGRLLLERIPVRVIDGVGDRVLARGIPPQRQYADGYA